MINLYYHYGAENHGCEAIVRSTEKIVKDKLRIYAVHSVDEDKRYGLDKIGELIHDNRQPIDKVHKFIAALKMKLTKSEELYYQYSHKTLFDNVKKGDLYLSVGGDDYCYSGVEILSYYNSILKKKGAKTVLWGCSVEPSVLTESVIKDLKNYDLITARETITYNALLEAGITKNTRLYPDPAFQLDKVDLPLPEGLEENRFIGINLSPLAAAKEKISGIALKNYFRLIDYILSETEYNVALIPHVVKKDSDDRVTLNTIHEKYRSNTRVVMMKDYNCMEIKGFISRAHSFIGARTHATIAAYSTMVPTLVVGYSVKARGIAKDIFGDYGNYVLPVQNIENDDDLLNAYLWIEHNYNSIKQHLESVIPQYRGKSKLAADELVKLENKS